MPIRHRYWAVAAAALLLLVLALVGSRFVSPRYRISKETTYLVEPLTHGGKRVDYWSAIHEATRPDNLASEENGYRLLLQKLGRSPDGDPESFSKLCELLGLAPDSIRPEIAFVEPQDFIKAYVESDDFDDSWLDELPDGDEFEFWPEDESDKRRRVERLLEARLYSPWNLDNLPMMARWLDENNAALDLMDQATRRSTFLIPVVTRDDETVAISAFDVHEFARMRTFSRGLKTRANFRIGTGDLDGAIDDIVTLKRLARHAKRLPETSMWQSNAPNRPGDAVLRARSWHAAPRLFGRRRWDTAAQLASPPAPLSGSCGALRQDTARRALGQPAQSAVSWRTADHLSLSR
jgi:hypothetical protein